MIDYYLKATSEDEITATLEKAAVVGSLDVVGEIPDVNGFHVNLRVTEPLSEEQIKVLSVLLIEAPTTPYRVWM
jgi:hypothetical protein